MHLTRRSQCQADEPKQAMKSQHDLYWEERCDTSPTAPGCKIYDD